MQEARQAHLIECDTSKIPFLCALINYIKEHMLTAPIWGGHAHITETVDWDSPKGDLSRFVSMSQDHTCYNMSVTSVKVRGIANIDKMANIYCQTSGDRCVCVFLATGYKWVTVMHEIPISSAQTMTSLPYPRTQ
jgi:hypothetical protein